MSVNVYLLADMSVKLNLHIYRHKKWLFFKCPKTYTFTNTSYISNADATRFKMRRTASFGMAKFIAVGKRLVERKIKSRTTSGSTFSFIVIPLRNSLVLCVLVPQFLVQVFFYVS